MIAQLAPSARTPLTDLVGIDNISTPANNETNEMQRLL